MKKQSVIPPVLHSPSFRTVILTALHFTGDLMSGLLPGFLPVVLLYFNLNLSMGVIILTSMSIGCNLIQIPCSRLDRQSRSPRMLVLGICMAGLVLLLGMLPSTTPVWFLAIIMFAVGTGIAIVHPFGLRGLVNQGKESIHLRMPLFMTAGFLGASMGPLISSFLVGEWGIKGLYVLIPLIPMLIAGIYLSHIRLYRENETTRPPGERSKKKMRTA